MQIKDAMAREPLSVRADATIQEAAAGDAGIGVLPVVTNNGEPAGIVTDRDIAVRAVAEGHTDRSTGKRGTRSSVIVIWSSARR